MWTQAVCDCIVPFGQSARAITVGDLWRNPCQNQRLLAVEQKLMASLDGPQVSELLQPNGYARCAHLDRLLVDLWRVLPDTSGGETFNRAQLRPLTACKFASRAAYEKQMQANSDASSSSDSQ